MDVKHLGHACFRVDHQEADRHVRLVMDPWFNPAFLKSWFPWPDNRHHKQEVTSADFLYISHAHEDHFDRHFLRENMTHVPVIVPKFRSRYLEHEVRALGFTDVFVLKHGESHLLSNNFRVTMLIDRSHKEDSALLCEDLETGYRFLNSNDCELSAADWPGNVDLLAAQYSGAFWYPHCYGYTSEQEREKAAEVRKNNLDRLVRRIKLTSAREYLPSAGPPVFLDPSLKHYNFRGIFTQYIDVDEDLMAQCPGLQLHPAMHGGIIHYDDYVQNRREEWESWYREDDARAENFEIIKHFRELSQANSRFLDGYTRDIGIYSGRDEWYIQVGLVQEQLEEDEMEPTYFMNVPPRVLRAVLDGKATWETALLSNRIDLRRRPDKYDYKLMGLLSFGDRPAQTRAMHRAQRASETIERDGLIMPRYCPHAGEDLSIAEVCNGVITCPRHGWSWTDKGECITAEIPLEVRKA